MSESIPNKKTFAQQISGHAGLFSLLTIATFFEGFDTKLASVVQPLLAKEFSADPSQIGLVLGLSSLGMVLAFFVIHLADVVGRRPVFLGALAAYATLTLATAFAPNLIAYTVLQFLARMAMVTELSLAYLILSEELPAAIRGRANGTLGAFAVLGAALPLALLAPLAEFGIGWRGLFVIGAIPVLLLPLYGVRLHETRAFEQRKQTQRFDLKSEWALVKRLFGSEFSSRLLSVTFVWFSVNFWAGTAMSFLTFYVFEERGWVESDLAFLPLGTVPVGMLGYLLCGVAMDRLGRRPAATLYLIATALVTAVCYQIESKMGIYIAWSLMLGLNGVWTILTTWTLELFPTDLRATALGVSANLLGRLGMVVGPIAAGFLSTQWDSIGSAITILGTVQLLCLPILWMGLPETRGREMA